MYVVRGVFYASTIGIVLAVIFRDAFDGVAILLIVIAVVAFITNLYLETQREERNAERYHNDFD